MQKITPCLWFDNNAEEAVNFYTSTFKNSAIHDVSYYGEAGPGEKGNVLTMTFQLEGQEYMALNGGPHFKFTPAISLLVSCKDQAEVDYLWERLLEGGEESQCGWLTDRYGLSWQIVPVQLNEMLSQATPEQAQRITEAFLSMKKLDIRALEAARRG